MIEYQKTKQNKNSMVTFPPPMYRGSKVFPKMIVLIHVHFLYYNKLKNINSRFSWPLSLILLCQPNFLTLLSLIRKVVLKVTLHQSCTWEMYKQHVLKELIGVLHRSWNRKSGETGKVWLLQVITFTSEWLKSMCLSTKANTGSPCHPWSVYTCPFNCCSH